MLKEIIRKKILKKRKKYFKEKSIKYSLLKKILKDHNLGKDKIIGGYYPINFEMDCLNILYKLKNDGFRISLPKIMNDKKMFFYNWSFEDPLIVNKLGIPEPENSYKVIPDVLLVPLVAFDRFKNRLGYGGGYYDRYIKKNEKKILVTIGIAFNFQKVKRIEIEPYDKKLNLIVTN